MLNSAAAKAIVGCLSFVALLAQVRMAAGSQQSRLPEPVLTTKRLFTIPFYINPGSRAPQRVVLFVSGDKGQSWTLYQTRTSQFKKFDFHAGEDGEFWFVVRTDGQAPPNAATPPEKVVIVDQHEPELEVQVELSPGGQLKARWTANDPNLDAKTFRLEYQHADDDRWRPVTVRIPPTEASTSFVGDVSWVPAQDAGELLVRAEILDSAGNPAVFRKRLRMIPMPVARGPVERRLSDRGPDSTPAVAARPAPRSEQTSGPTTSSTDLSYPRPGPAGIVQSDNRPSASSPSTFGWRTTAPDQSLHSSGVDSRVETPTMGYDILDPLVHPLDSVSRANVGRGPIQGDYLSPVASQVVPESSPSQLSHPVNRQIQMTNSRRFNLEYDVSHAGDSGVARVELWITTDEGRTWSAHGTDDDVESPFLVELSREGTYGFRLLIHNGLGASAGPPQSGDQADLWVGIDLTPPQARISSARLGTGAHTGILDIGWDASDRNLPENPIRLSYAERLDGPWMPVAEPLPNSGYYRWRIPEKVTDWVYLKIDVTDQAGNMTSHQLPNPVSTIPVPPSGRIRAISPLGGRAAAGS